MAQLLSWLLVLGRDGSLQGMGQAALGHTHWGHCRTSSRWQRCGREEFLLQPCNHGLQFLVLPFERSAPLLELHELSLVKGSTSAVLGKLI
jgi:hypothetical protein